MASKSSPRHGSLQFWPRKRAKKDVARVRSWANKDGLLGFAGYKVGMTHAFILDERKNSVTKGKQVFTPVTVIECPPIKIVGARLYSSTFIGTKVLKEVIKYDKSLSRKLTTPKKDSSQKAIETLNSFEKELGDGKFLRAIVATQPGLTGIGKKRPDVFEIAIGGSIQDQFSYIKEHFGKELKVSDVMKTGSLLDIHSITTGKGFNGPVKRYGISLRSHKSEKGVRRPGSIGTWYSTLYTAPMPGQVGFHTRTDFNKWLVSISSDLENINPKGGFVGYGLVKNDYILLKGSIPGPKKRLIKFNYGIRENSKLWSGEPKIIKVSLESKQ